jgi:undecaprenyl pyrophosphate synthase
MEIIEELMPKHIAIIMDGNRRWAKQRNLPVKLGHKQGAETLKKVVRYANKIGIKYLTVYAFSTENWKRTKEEVGALMLLLQNYLDIFAKTADAENIRIKMLGDRNGLSEGLLKKIDNTIEITTKPRNDSMTITYTLNGDPATDTSNDYSGPIDLTPIINEKNPTSVTVKVRAELGGYQISYDEETFELKPQEDSSG